MNKKTIIETTTRSLAGTITFPEVVGILSGEGVESYHVDLIQMLKTCYFRDGNVLSEPFEFVGNQLGQEFSKEKVIESINSIQQQKINYRTFLNQILAAGCMGYAVYIDGMKAIYFGRMGDFHIEEF